MSVWVAMPSKRLAAEAERVLAKWRDRGYKIALWIDANGEPGASVKCNALWVREIYPGYAAALNTMCAGIITEDPQAEWIVAAADDVWPDPNHSAEEIAQECSEHWGVLYFDGSYIPGTATFGVMQPIGDRWGDRQGAYIDRVAGSPWIGREFARRMYGGAGPYWHEYLHMYVDEELQCVAQKLGVFWQRPDLIHFHDHWGRAKQGENMAPQERMPAFLERANSWVEWRKANAIFEKRRAAGFPGHEPIA